MKIFPDYNEIEKASGWRISVTISNKYYRLWFPTKAEAEEFISRKKLERRAQKLGLFVPKSTRAVTLHDAYPHYKAAQEGKAGARANCRIVTEFLVTLPADQAFKALTKTTFAAYLRLLQARQLHNTTINTYLDRVRGFCKFAAGQYAELADWKIPELPHVARTTGRQRILTVQEVRALYAELLAPRAKGEQFKTVRRREDHLSDLFALCLLTGARPGELLALKWEQVNFDFGFLTLHASKTNTERILPLTESVRAILHRRKQIYPDKVFPEVIDESSQALLFKNASRRAGIPYGDQTPGGWVLYDCRHTAATAMLQAGSDIATVARALGHRTSNQGTTFIYVHATPESLRQALIAAERFWLSCRASDGSQRHNPSEMDAKRHSAGN